MNENEKVIEDINASAEVTVKENEKIAVIGALETKDIKVINKAIKDIYPIDLAMIAEELDSDQIGCLFDAIDNEKLAEIVEQADEDLQMDMMQLLDNHRIISMFEYMPKDDIVDLLGELPVHRRKDIMNLIKLSDRNIIQNLLGYDEDTAGGIMTTEYIALKGDLTIEATLAKIKEIAPKTEVIDTIFVLNRRRQLIGTVDLREILIAPYDSCLQEVMNEHVISVEPEMDQEEVSLLVSKYDLKVIPVLNKKQGMLGIITVDDIIDVIVEEHTEDMLHMGGVSKEEDVSSTLGESVRMRMPWLFVNLITAFLASFTVSIFEGTIAQVVALASAMSIVSGMGGNAGSQTLSIVIRSIALGEIQLKKSWRLVFKEILLGIINGAGVGIVTGILMYIKYGNIYLGLIIFAAMVINIAIAGIFGFLIPLFLKAINVDPALASTIFLTTATDVGGFFVFLGLAQLFLPLLV